MSIDAGFEDLVKQLDVTLEANSFADLVKMFLSNFRFEFGIVEQEIGEFGSLLHQVDLGHAFGFAFELGGGNAD